MDSELKKRLRHLSMQNDVLRQAEGEYLLKEAKRKSMEGDLYLITEGGNVAERQAKVHANEDYLSFMKDLAELQTKYNFEKRRFSILESAYLAEHVTFNRDMKIISKHGVET